MLEGILKKSFDDITYKDIEHFIKLRIPESDSLDYKGDILQKNSKLKAKDFGKDVSSFANTSGGWLIYGVETDKSDDETLPRAQNAIVGIRDYPGLSEKIENLILSSISPKPYFRMKKVSIPKKDKCLFLIHVYPAYNHVHMVSLKNEHRFYKRYEYQAIPMDYYEVLHKFEDIGKSEIYRSNKIEILSNQILDRCAIGNTNFMRLVVSPKIPLENHFNDYNKAKNIYESEKLYPIARLCEPLKRRYNSFIVLGREGKFALNFSYDGNIILFASFALFNGYIYTSRMYSFIIKYFDIAQYWYREFNFNGLADISFTLKGIIGREMAFEGMRNDLIYKKLIDPKFKEEIDSQKMTCELDELVSRKREFAEEFLLPLYYSQNYNFTVGLVNDKGNPIYDFYL